mgnify:CR=1 FL=1
MLYLIGIATVPTNIVWLAIFLFLGAFALSSIGLITGIWAQKFDQLSIISNFVVQPLAFLSGMNASKEFAAYSPESRKYSKFKRSYMEVSLKMYNPD